MNKYEFPLNERIRKFLRIEEIFKKMEAQNIIKKNFLSLVVLILFLILWQPHHALT